MSTRLSLDETYFVHFLGHFLLVWPQAIASCSAVHFAVRFIRGDRLFLTWSPGYSGRSAGIARFQKGCLLQCAEYQYDFRLRVGLRVCVSHCCIILLYTAGQGRV